MFTSALPKQDAAMAQYRDIVRKHTSFTLDLLRVIPHSSSVLRTQINAACASPTLNKALLRQLSRACMLAPSPLWRATGGRGRAGAPV